MLMLIIKYMKKGIELEHSNSVYRLGQYYHDNIDFISAKKFYKNGCKFTNNNSYFNLAVMYREGDGG